MSSDCWVIIEHVGGRVTDFSYAMLAAARSLSSAAGGRSVAVLLGHDAGDLAADLDADGVLFVDDPALAEFTSDSYARAIAALIDERHPRVVLLGDTTVGADIAGELSVQLGLPLVSHCLDVTSDGAAIRYLSQTCGGKVMVEGELPGPTALAAMIPGMHKPEEGRATTPPPVEEAAALDLGPPLVKLLGYIEPEAGDVDITRSKVLIAVGRGLQNGDNLELAEELAEALGGDVCASRPVVDQGWLPATRLVGKSGRRVRPTVYFALGISGAPEHTEAITDSDVIIAVNTDPTAPIFDIARYGAEADMLDLMPALTERILEAKG